jgi:tetratricopeptide (TPR) repeat protein
MNEDCKEETLESLYNKAETLRKAGELEEAAAAYEAAIAKAKASDSPDAAYHAKMFAGMLGPVYYKLQKYDLAKPLFEIVGHDMPKPPSNLKTTANGIKSLIKYNLLSELTPKLKKRIYEETGDPMDSELIGFLTCYYQYGVDDQLLPEHKEGERVTPLTPRALKDGFLIYDHRFANDSDDIAADLCDIIGGEPMYHQVESDFYSKPYKFVLGTTGGETIKVDVEDIDDIVAFFNEALEKRGDLRRIVSIETESDFSAWMIMSNAMFKDLCQSKVPTFKVEATPGVNVERWLKQKAKS